jgi:transposase-like protein
MSSWGEEQQQHQRKRRRFTEEFKRDAVNLVRTTGRPIAEIACELGIYDSTLGNWVRQDRIDRPWRSQGGSAATSGPACGSWNARSAAAVGA